MLTTKKADYIQPFLFQNNLKMAIIDDFENAVAKSKELTQRPTNDELLNLYALFKQGSEGDITGERPGGFDFKGAAKFDAWKKLEGTSSDNAMQQYISLVDQLHSKY